MPSPGVLFKVACVEFFYFNVRWGTEYNNDNLLFECADSEIWEYCDIRWFIFIRSNFFNSQMVFSWLISIAFKRHLELTTKPVSAKATSNVAIITYIHLFTSPKNKYWNVAS